jgi:citrate synthase
MDSLQTLARNIDRLKLKHIVEREDYLLAFVSLSSIIAAKLFVKSKGQELLKPNPALGHAANFLWLVNGKEPSLQDIQDFQTCLILHMDDPDNPSLIGLRRVIGEGGTISEGLIEALSKHVDVLHHGAGTEAMKMLREIRETGDVEEYLRRRVESGNKIFGLGHRIYRGVDPRSIVLNEILSRRVLNTEHAWIPNAIQQVIEKGSNVLSELKGVNAYANVDLYNAATYLTFGFNQEFNTTLFALSRVAGWSAHILDVLYSHS